MRSATSGARCGRRLRVELGGLVLGLVVVAEQGRGQRLRQLRAVAIERDRLEAELPGQLVGLLAILDRRGVRHVDRLRDRAGDEGLRRRHHPDMAVDREAARADAAARVGAVEHRQVLGLQMRRAFQRHRAAAIGVGGLDLGPGEAERGQQVEAGIGERAPARSRAARCRTLSPSVHLLNANLMSKAEASAAFDRGERRRVEALARPASRG